MKWFIGVLLVAIVCSCNNSSTPADIIPAAKMQLVLWDYMQADVYAADIIKLDSSRRDTIENIRLQKAVFNKHGIDREKFYASYAYYQKHPEQMKVMIDSMVNFQRRKDTIKGKILDYGQTEK